ncbi:PREDICTED: probable calcium-binding protein CML49 [Populus euphratica]|uniref:Probable calcium-binding protein CML49 n=1 Tax=Populus euphratica TaxID=75702 RepID=A0AAJ6YA39_POPEU|nr:PREDICTED: probable calcium-binding protein CML49 [Populus euphratica]
MSGYPHPQAGYGYGQPQQPQPYGSAAPYSSPYGAPPQPSAPYGAAPQPAAAYGAAQPAAPYGAPAPGTKPPKDKPQASAPGGYPPAPYGSSPFASLMPSTFPPGTDPTIVACFQLADQDGSGLVDDKELQRALSSYNQSFSLRTVHLLMYLFTNTNTRKIGPKEFAPLFYSLQNWRANFERFDRDRSGKIDYNELREALMSLGFAVSPVVLDLLVSKFDKTGGKNKAIEYDNFIECCLTVKGLTDKFKERDPAYSGSASFTYENFMLTVLPFLIA